MTETIPKSNRPRLALRIVLVTALVLLLIPVVIDQYSRIKLNRAVQDYSSGPLAFHEFHPEPLPEGTVNGTDFEEAASLVVDGQDLTYSPRQGTPDSGLMAVRDVLKQHNSDRSPLGEDDLELFRKQIDRLDLALRVLDSGLEQTHRARYRTDWTVPPWDIQIPNLLSRLRLSSLLRARGEVAMAEGRWEDAWQEAAKIQRFAYWSADSLPTLINALVARAIAYEGFLFVQKLLAGPAVDPSFLEAVATEAHRLSIKEHYDYLLDAERSSAFTSLIDPRSTSFGAVIVPRGFPLWMSARRWVAADYLNWAGPSLDACEAPSHALSDEPFEFAAPDSLKAKSLALFAFDCRDVSRKRDLALAALDHFDIALELDAHRRGHGTYPADLASLKHAGADPFSASSSYRYELQEDGGYKLWSASYNGTDDGGALAGKAKAGNVDWESGDFVWWVRGPLTSSAAVSD